MASGSRGRARARAVAERRAEWDAVRRARLELEAARTSARVAALAEGEILRPPGGVGPGREAWRAPTAPTLAAAGLSLIHI